MYQTSNMFIKKFIFNTTSTVYSNNEIKGLLKGPYIVNIVVWNFFTFMFKTTTCPKPEVISNNLPNNYYYVIVCYTYPLLPGPIINIKCRPGRSEVKSLFR